MICEFVKIELKNTGSKYLKEKNYCLGKRRCGYIQGITDTSGSPSVLAEVSGPPVYYAPSYLGYQCGAECDGKGEPSCHPSRFSRAAASPNKQSLPTPKYKHQAKQMVEEKNLQNTYKSFFTPESSPVAPCWRASKASREKAFPISKLSKGEEKPISTAAFLSLSRRPFLAWYCTPQWSLRDICAAQSLFWC